MIQAVYLRRSLNHKCTESIHFSVTDTELQSNSLIYTYEKNEYECYKIVEIHKKYFTCNPIGIFPHVFNETPTLNWESVGVFKKGGTNDKNVKVNIKKIAGKIIHVNGLFITCPTNILREK